MSMELKLDEITPLSAPVGVERTFTVVVVPEEDGGTVTTGNGFFVVVVVVAMVDVVDCSLVVDAMFRFWLGEFCELSVKTRISSRIGLDHSTKWAPLSEDILRIIVIPT